MECPYGLDLRKKVILLSQERGITKKELSGLLNIGEATIFRGIKRIIKGEELNSSRL